MQWMPRPAEVVRDSLVDEVLGASIVALEERCKLAERRLAYLIAHSARVAQVFDGGYRCCRYHEGRLRWLGEMKPSAEAAIDSAIAAGEAAHG
jgi:hypothetical protein